MIEFWQCFLLIFVGALLVTLLIIGLAIIRYRCLKKYSNTGWDRAGRSHHHCTIHRIQDSPTVSVPLMIPFTYVNELSYDDNYASF